MLSNEERAARHQAQVEEWRQELREETASLWARTANPVLELGCGHGHYLTAYAEAHPEVFCIGIDRLGGRIRKASRKAERQGLENLAFVRADIDDLLAIWPEDCRPLRYLILFSDPWPKKRHIKNRMLQPERLSQLAHIATPGAELCFRTDFEPYFAWSCEQVEAHPDWSLTPDAPWPFEHSSIFQERADRHHSFVTVTPPL